MSVDVWVLEHESTIRLSFFAGVFLLLAGWELVAPCRPLTVSKSKRWFNNIALVVVNTLLLRFLFPVAAIGVAVFATEQGWGLFNVITLPLWVMVLLSVVLLDLVIYLQHVMVHAVPLFWRLHRVHHADLDYDVTTGARFHPLEIMLSMLVKFAVILLLGPPLIAVVIFEVLLNVTSMFNHGNVSLPAGIDRWLRWWVVTPDMHRVHHSVNDDETNSNFGFSLPWWDRIFGTYRAQPRQGHQGMTIGIRTFRDERQCATLPGMLAIPFIGRIQSYAINRRDWDGKHDGE